MKKENKKDKTKTRTNVQPLADRVLIKPIVERVTASGIIIPDTVKLEKLQRGEVIAVGSGRITEKGVTIPPAVKPGDIVLFTKSEYTDAVTELKINDEAYCILPEAMIIGVMKK